MHDDLLPYYNDELMAVRHLAREFAAQFPKVAGRLLIEGDQVEDPHVERLIEAFAFLTARLRRKLDDEFPEITDALLGVLYPHYLRPIPSMSIVQFQIDPDELHLTGLHTIARHRDLFSRPVNGVPCHFRTAYPVDLWPIRVRGAKVEALEKADFAARGNDAVAAVKITLEALGGTAFGTLKPGSLRFFIDADAPVAFTLYELLFASVHSIDVGNGKEKIGSLPPEAIRQVGFEADEGMLDYDARSLIGYRLLHEYFTFPDKFLFFDVAGLAQAIPEGAGKTLELTIYLKTFERRERLFSLTQAVTADTFRMGCTPIVNLFRQNAEPLIISHQKTEYQVIPDVRRPWGLEVYSVDTVRKLVKSGERGDVVEYRPFYSLRHGTSSEDEDTYWTAARRPSPRQDDAGTDVYLSLVDLNFDPSLPATDALFIQATCLNRDLPGMLPFGGDQGDLQVEGEAPVARIRCLRKPTATLRPNQRKGSYWRLISHLSLNHLSIVDGGREALLEILSLYNFFDSPALQKQIAGITKVDSAPGLARVGPPQRQAFVRGLDVTLEFDEDMYVGGGIYLLASVLERFLGLYCSINSFTRLTVTSQQREKPVAGWKPRSGSAIVA